MKREELYAKIDKAVVSENYFRALIRKTIGQFEFGAKKRIVVEKLLRAKIQKIINEKKETIQYASTGLNRLDDMFMNSNFLNTLERGYKTLVTSDEQKSDYENHVINTLINMLAQEDVDSPKEVTESLQHLLEADDEEIDISIAVEDDDIPEDKIVGPERRDREEAAEEATDDTDADEPSLDPEKDITGQVSAEDDVAGIQGTILKYYKKLGNPTDRKDFKIYLVANLKMYFKTWRESGENEIEPPANAEVDQAISDAEAKLEAPEETPEAEAEAPEEGGEEELDLGL